MFAYILQFGETIYSCDNLESIIIFDSNDSLRISMMCGGVVVWWCRDAKHFCLFFDFCVTVCILVFSHEHKEPLFYSECIH